MPGPHRNASIDIVNCQRVYSLIYHKRHPDGSVRVCLAQSAKYKDFSLGPGGSSDLQAKIFASLSEENQQKFLLDELDREIGEELGQPCLDICRTGVCTTRGPVYRRYWSEKPYEKNKLRVYNSFISIFATDISGAVNRTSEEIEAEFTAAFHRGKHDGEIMDIKWYSMDALIKDVSEGRLEFWPEHKEYMNMSKHFRRFFGVKDSLLNSRLSPPPRPRTPTKDTAVRKH